MSTDNSSDSSFLSSEVSIPRPIRFWLMLLFNIPSIICTFCLIYHIISNRAQRYALHNHTILLILIFGLPIQLMDINFYLVFFRYGTVPALKPIICLLWWLADYGFIDGGTILICWLSIERHILIFHYQWVATRRGRFLFHYLPLIMIVIYICLFYIVVIFLVPCENTYDYSLPACGASPCYQTYGILGMWESIVHATVPVLLECFVSAGLILRVQWQKRRLQQSTQWHKQRRMIIQLFLVSAMNLTLDLPLYLIGFAHLFGLPAEYGIQAELYFYFLGYFIIFLFPFVSLCQFPKLRQQIKRKILDTILRQPNQTATVAPAMMGIPLNRLT